MLQHQVVILLSLTCNCAFLKTCTCTHTWCMQMRASIHHCTIVMARCMTQASHALCTSGSSKKQSLVFLPSGRSSASCRPCARPCDHAGGSSANPCRPSQAQASGSCYTPHLPYSLCSRGPIGPHHPHPARRIPRCSGGCPAGPSWG